MIKHVWFILSASMQRKPMTVPESLWKENNGHPRAEGQGLESLSVKLGFSERKKAKPLDSWELRAELRVPWE